MTIKNDLYNAPAQFEPLMPGERASRALFELAHEVIRVSLRLTGGAHPAAKIALAPLLRAMNSYYTNRIEGQHTLPTDIERALAGNYTRDPDRARLQREAMAHLNTEAWAEQTLASASWRGLFSTQAVCSLHAHLYGQLPEEDRRAENGEILLPGALRARDVKVGRHVAPKATAVPAFLDRWSGFYATLPEGENALIGVACAHHRLAWVHPFLDGNGRVARLHSYAALYAMGLSGGLWSPMRGLARAQQVYYDRLHNADEPRENDLDGRGNLSEKRLVEFAVFFLETCLDQARFMHEMLDLAKLKERIRALLAFEAAKPASELRMEALAPLHYAFVAGPVERGEFKAMTGLASRTAERLLAALLKHRLLISPSPKGKVGFGVPYSALRFYFPSLWPEAEADAARHEGLPQE